MFQSGKSKKRSTAPSKSGKVEPEIVEKIPCMYLLEMCVNPTTASSPQWQHDFVPIATQLLLAGRASYIVVRNSWNPMPFEHFASKPATCQITTVDATFVWTDARVWSRQEIYATCEDCDFVSGNMWFYIPSGGAPRSPDELFRNVVDPLLEWSRPPSGTGEAIGSAEESLGLLYWNVPERIVDVAEQELRRLASKIGIVIENEDAMVIDCLHEQFGDPEEAVPDETMLEDVAPPLKRRIPLRDWFWLAILLIVLQLFYLISKIDAFRQFIGFE